MRLEETKEDSIITIDHDDQIISYEEKTTKQKGDLPVLLFYYYRNENVKKIAKVLEDGWGYDAPES